MTRSSSPTSEKGSRIQFVQKAMSVFALDAVFSNLSLNTELQLSLKIRGKGKSWHRNTKILDQDQHLNLSTRLIRSVKFRSRHVLQNQNLLITAARHQSRCRNTLPRWNAAILFVSVVSLLHLGGSERLRVLLLLPPSAESCFSQRRGFYPPRDRVRSWTRAAGVMDERILEATGAFRVQDF